MFFQEILSAVCFDTNKRSVKIAFKDDFQLNDNIFQTCVKDVKSRTTKTGAWRKVNYLENFGVITERKSIFLKVTFIKSNGDGSKEKSIYTEISKNDMKTCGQFEAKKGTETKLGFKALNKTHLEINWTSSFNVDFDVVNTVVLYKVEQNGSPLKIGQAHRPFDPNNTLVTSKALDLCLSQKFFVQVKAKEEFKDKAWYKSAINRYSTWYPPHFLQVREVHLKLNMICLVQDLKEGSCYKNKTGTIFIPFKTNPTLHSSLFLSCVPTLQYKTSVDSGYLVMNRTDDMDTEQFEEQLVVRADILTRIEGEMKEEKLVLTSDQLNQCEEENEESDKSETEDNLTWIVGLVGGIVGGVILGSIFIISLVKMRKGSNTDEEEGVDINPDYGCDYGEFEIRDNNDYYFADDYDYCDQINIQNTETEDLDKRLSEKQM